MKRLLIAIFIVIFSLSVLGCGGNNIVKEVRPQSEKAEYFSSFEDEKKFMINEAFDAVRKTGERPVAYYGDQAHFNKGSNYSAFTGYIECENRKLAYVHVQYDMQDTAELHKKFKAMSNEEINKVPADTISKVVNYRSYPRVYSSNATIRDNFLYDRYH